MRLFILIPIIYLISCDSKRVTPSEDFLNLNNFQTNSIIFKNSQLKKRIDKTLMKEVILIESTSANVYRLLDYLGLTLIDYMGGYNYDLGRYSNYDDIEKVEQFFIKEKIIDSLERTLFAYNNQINDGINWSDSNAVSYHIYYKQDENPVFMHDKTKRNKTFYELYFKGKNLIETLMVVDYFKREVAIIEGDRYFRLYCSGAP